VKLQSNIYLFMWSAHCQDYVSWGSQPIRFSLCGGFSRSVYHMHQMFSK